jgi:hypothetical protein
VAWSATTTERQIEVVSAGFAVAHPNRFGGRSVGIRGRAALAQSVLSSNRLTEKQHDYDETNESKQEFGDSKI